MSAHFSFPSQSLVLTESRVSQCGNLLVDSTRTRLTRSVCMFVFFFVFALCMIMRYMYIYVEMILDDIDDTDARR